MLTFHQKTDRPASDTVALAYDLRKRSRLRVTLASGIEVGIFLERGECLKNGDRLLAEDGNTVIEVVAAPESLIEATADTALLWARAAFHLGNRHVPVQLLPAAEGGRLRLQTDHVLAALLRSLGCSVRELEDSFQPEPGAYGNHGGGHFHSAKIHEFKPR